MTTPEQHAVSVDRHISRNLYQLLYTTIHYANQTPVSISRCLLIEVEPWGNRFQSLDGRSQRIALLFDHAEYGEEFLASTAPRLLVVLYVIDD